MLHSIGVGNMLPSWVKVICVDINPAVVTKLSDRGSTQTIGIVTDVGLFLHQLAEQFEETEHVQDPDRSLDARAASSAIRTGSSSTAVSISPIPTKGEELYREAHIPGARYAHLDRHLSGHEDRQERPASAARFGCDLPQLQRSRASRRACRSWPTTRDSGMYAAACGGCCDGWDTMRWRCSMAASRAGSVKDIPCAAASNRRRRATSRARRVPAGA